jgi:hypothetical protein
MNVVTVKVRKAAPASTPPPPRKFRSEGMN